MFQTTSAMISISVAQSAGVVYGLDQTSKPQHLQHHFERGNFSPCSSPEVLDSRWPYDLHQMMLRRELEEQIVVQQAIELQRRRLISLQLPDFKNDGVHHHQRGLSVSLSADSHAGGNVDPSDSSKQEVSEASVPSIMNAVELEEVKSTCVQKFGVGNSQEYQGKANEQ
ncbi:hypothetical protein V6N11_062019 [Hibiscus sabdariffa]|uniref:Uncharacterized protein n=2 Tax=Hibiscus sabdariffa TaxID=183260 RepID=A0ABR2AIF9_9ROSI